MPACGEMRRVWRERHFSVRVWKVKRMCECVCVCVCVCVSVEEQKEMCMLRVRLVCVCVHGWVCVWWETRVCVCEHTEV